jgi:cell division protease FtsH
MFLGREIQRHEAHSNETSLKIDEEIDRVLTEAHDTARAILEEHRDKLEMISEVLIRYETLDGEQVIQMLETGEIPEELKNGKTPAEKIQEEKEAAEAAEAAGEEDTSTESEEAVESTEKESEEKPKENPSPASE